MSPNDLKSAVDVMLRGAQLDGEIDSLEILNGGKNNQTYKLILRDGNRYVVKKYFQHAEDPRDRQNSEFLFSAYAGKVCPGHVAKVYCRDQSIKATLFEFINGEPIVPGSVGTAEINCAINFINTLNSLPLKSDAAALPAASEACFSVEEHLDLVESRVGTLQALISEDLDQETSQFIDELSRFWTSLKDLITLEAKASGIDINSKLALEDRCISPSDFGFHNAIKDRHKNIRFIDFEYAGWDDPAKLVGDFFAQLAVPIPEEFSEKFIDSIALNFSDAQGFKIRANLLMPVYQIKWCCIALNVFLPAHLSRRQFSSPLLDVSSLKAEQLAKAKILLTKLQNKNYELH
jgi:hypothetical protein